MLSRFGELAAEVVVGSRPVEHARRRLNQGFAWTRATGVQSNRSKAHLPDAPDGWEATWFARGTLDPAPLTTGGHRRWRLAASLMGIVSGCFVASANRRSYERDDFVGQSWIVSPEGDILAETTIDKPIATVIVDLRDVTSAKQSYPRNLPQG